MEVAPSSHKNCILESLSTTANAPLKRKLNDDYLCKVTHIHSPITNVNFTCDLFITHVLDTYSTLSDNGIPEVRDTSSNKHCLLQTPSGYVTEDCRANHGFTCRLSNSKTNRVDKANLK
mgnify:CR=1 FL=1